MIAGGGLRPRLDSALVAKWPEPLDISTDIFIPGKTTAFRSQLIAALQSRDLWSAISATDPTIESISVQNPQATRDEVEEALRTAMAGGRSLVVQVCKTWCVRVSAIAD